MTAALQAGDCFFHEQAPFELLYLLGSSGSGELWRCKPLYVEDTQTKDIFIQGPQDISQKLKWMLRLLIGTLISAVGTLLLTLVKTP